MIPPGFDILQSNRLETLAGRLCEDLSKAPLTSPLAKEIILVQDPSVGRWLELFMARATGIAANLRFLNPAQFVADLYRSLDPAFRSGSPFDPEVLQWRIFAVLEDRTFRDRFAELSGFLRAGDRGKAFDLAGRIAEVFGRYLVYRMDWLAAWEAGREGQRGGDELWQAALWRALAIPGWRNDALYDRLRSGLEDGSVRIAERISVLGISSLSPAYAALLQAAGKHAAVRVYSMNPCREEWGEIVSERKFADLEYSPELLHFEVPHALLGSLGKQGRDFMSIVYERAGEGAGTTDLFEASDADSLLHVLQNGILDLTETAWAPRPGDASVQIHRCHTPMREVQILRDRLLNLFQRDPSLKPSDVMVLAPDISIYAPYIEAVFSPAPGCPAGIPVEIADRVPTQMDPVAETWLALLDLKRTRFEADDVVGLLRLPPIASSFGIASDEIPQLSAWVERSGIRWGIDGTHKRAFDLPGNDLFTWAWGLDRLALGVALPNAAEGGELYHGVLPYDRVEGQEVDLLDRFIGFVSALRAWLEDLGTPRTMDAWGMLLGAWLDRFFSGGKEIAERREEIRAALEQAVAGSTRGGFLGRVDYAVIRRIMLGALGENRQGLRFHSGGVVFCSMKPMRALPFRVICLLGFSDGEYPRERRSPGFDLMRRYYRHGDRSGRQDDRYLFLELLLSARERLIVSYVGEDIYSGKIIPPSPVLGEFLDFIGRIAFSGESTDGKTPRERAEAALVIRHPMQSFSARYFDGREDDLFSYSTEDRNTSAAIRSGRPGERTVFPDPLPPPSEPARRISLDDLSAFWKNPTKFLLNKRLNIYYREEEELLEGSEPLVLGKSETRIVRSALLEAIRTGRLRDAAGRERLFAVLRADGKLPPGLPGSAGFVAEVERMDPVLQVLGSLLRKSLHGIAKVVQIGGWELEVEVTEGLTDQGLVLTKPGELRGRDILPFWIQCLGVSVAQRSSGSFVGSLLGLKEKEGEIQHELLRFGADADPKGILEELLRWYHEGLLRPIHFFPDSAWAYAEKYDQENDREAALSRARTAWVPGDAEHAFQESTNRYFARIFPPDDSALDDEFIRLAELIAVRAVSALEKAPKTRTRKTR